MHGGMKVYAGPPAAARQYLEADRGRADDYYLAEGTGLARRFTARDGRVQECAALIGETYEAWVAGRDPYTGTPRGRLRTDDRAVRFVEVVVNGPKSWSLAAAVHPDIAAAYDAAQDRAAAEIVGWLAGHATTRVGPRGGQVQVPIEVLEAVTVRHHTSRAGDPHRHLHLQIGARVFAAGKWRGLHTGGVRDFLTAINGIGHAAVACDPQFRAVLAAHGYTLDATGEILELAEYIGPFSARAAQIGRNLDRYERQWTKAHPGEQPGPALRRAWDTRAWADGRPDKVTPRSGTDLISRWRAELAALGFRDPDRPVDLPPTPVGALDRDRAVAQILTRLAAGRSAWNPADIRGEAERLIAGQGIVVDTAVRVELAEELTARALGECVPLLQREGVPEHVRAWTSPAVLEVEADLVARLAARSTHHGRDVAVGPALVAGLERLDGGQAATAEALAGSRPLVVVEGAAGAGKTTTLAAARRLLARQGRGLLVVTPTLKAARVASAEVGTAAGSAAWLAFQHGWRWNDDGAWTRLVAGQADPATGAVYAGPAEEARLLPGDLLVVDEAGMLDQDTARALLTIADEYEVRVALLGDRHQLAAVGRGGVLDLTVRAADPAARPTLDTVHRFIHRDDAGRTIPDTDYAELTLAMRRGQDAGAVFDALHARGQVRLHPDTAARLETLAALAASCVHEEAVAVVVDTREQAAELNAAIRDRLVAEGRVDDGQAVATRAGQRISAGDRIATRRNDRALGVANRDLWTVTAVSPHGNLAVTPARADASNVTPTGVTPAGSGERVLPADYVVSHVELAYASTAHGVQGDTVAAAHVVVGEHTGAAAAHVGMTRGRTANVAHLVADDLDEARKQWITVFDRDRADLGPAHSAELAATEAARYVPPRSLDAVLAELHAAWTAEQRCRDRLSLLEPMRKELRELITLQPHSVEQLAGLTGTHRQAAWAADQATHRVEASDASVAAEADRLRDVLPPPGRRACRRPGGGASGARRARPARAPAGRRRPGRRAARRLGRPLALPPPAAAHRPGRAGPGRRPDPRPTRVVVRAGRLRSPHRRTRPSRARCAARGRRRCPARPRAGLAGAGRGSPPARRAAHPLRSPGLDPRS
ncbi:ATP-dependent RecD-like DNA helicase [Geodermatophilus obscurus DSM 43160]|uniref:TrwC relaxase n=1 Tax=Geodermatophilus obscurus (strain ATCC 25078 / DSM 43160 / JCM 3152 / CCUG 61914 / KCC A-0152 / KCTC 9177 / NBRC 13315 / NRRL B-3577 / G-20) TaxID=526225 RepID=D2SF21_GEOOG|nr:TrwC relaxase [Geodermatophilus obscurus DSM 43160]